MARMIPSQCPPETASWAERHLFQCLESNLGEDYKIIHSLPWLDDDQRRLKEGECDFVVLHPLKGLLAIEAKSGGIRYDGNEKRWERGSGLPLEKDPFLQAQSSSHYLNKLLRSNIPGWRDLNPPFGHAVAFPDADNILKRGPLPPHISREILILRPDLERLQDRIDSILSRYHKSQTPLDKTTFEKVVSTLLPVFEVVLPLTAEISNWEECLLRLTAKQIDLLDAMRLNRRLIIRGCAGSGKTILAVEKTVRLASEGAQVLLLCFNIPLAEILSRGLQNRGISADVFHFHGLCEHVVKSTGSAFVIPKINVKDFYEHEASELLLTAVSSFSKRYDAIIVDEGQDFRDHWWIPLEELFNDIHTGIFYIFLDPGQNIYKCSIDLPFSEPVIVLDENCRNTASIASLVNKYGAIEGRISRSAPQGIMPQIIEVKNDSEELDGVQRVIADLANQGILTKDIVVLGNRTFKNSLFAKKSRLGKFRVIDKIDGC